MQKFVFDKTLEHVKKRKISHVNRGILYIAKPQVLKTFVFIRRSIYHSSSKRLLVVQTQNHRRHGKPICTFLCHRKY